MTVHIVSVGKSAVDFLNDPADDLFTDVASRDEFAEAVGRYLSRAPVELTEPASMRRWLTTHLGDARAADPWLDGAAAGLRVPEWPVRFSAEHDTLHRSRPASSDTVVLLVTDTLPGLRAGLFNALRMAGGEPGRISYADEPAAYRPGDGTVIVRVPGLDAGDGRGFRTAMTGLGSLAAGLHRRAGSAEPLTFHLSGGYKAAIPYLIGMAEWLRSADGDRQVTARVLHDTAPVGAPAVLLPLRSLPLDVARCELGGFGAGSTVDTEPRGGLLRGYAYEPDGSSYRLTPFGEGLRAFLRAVEGPPGVG